MYEEFVIHSNNLKYNPTELKKTPEEEKEKQETNSKDYETIRQLVKGTDPGGVSCPAEGYARRSPCGVKPTKKNNISSIIYQR